jgi:hypothetical protein
MTKKDELIIGILKKELISIKKCLKDQEEQISTIKKNGFDKNVHKGNRDSIWTGLHYTQGYCTAHIFMTKKVIDLLKLSDYKDVEALIEENKAIEKSNKLEFKKLFVEIGKETTPIKSNDNKKKNQK